MTTILENDLFQRPASYWLRRAERCKQSGDLIRAAVLQRHALRADPGSHAACAGYALTLRQLHCYEASNREAFAALAADPDRRELYGLVGLNLLAMGQRQGGLDALNVYLDDPPPVERTPVWHDEACDEAYDYEQGPPPRRRARLEGLMNIASRRLAAGDNAGAHRALMRASRAPFSGANAQRDLLFAVSFMRAGRFAQSRAHLMRAVSLRPWSARMAASAAGVLHAQGRRRQALKMLCKAALLAAAPADELAVCLACDQLDQPGIAYGMLTRALRHRADRFPVCYDLCVCLLRMGRLEEAAQHIHLCREIDPDDVAGEVLFQQVMAMEGLQPDEVRRRSAAIGYWGAFSQLELEHCAGPIAQQLQQGPEALAQALCTDVHLRRRFMHLMTLPAEWPAHLLALAGEHMDAQQCAVLARQVLLQTPSDGPVKRAAIALLQRAQVPPPYLAWQDGRFLWIDPTRQAGSAPFLTRHLTIRIHSAQRMRPDDRFFALWAMRVVHRMSPAQRRRMVADYLHMWPLALVMVYHEQMGLGPVVLKHRKVDPIDGIALRTALSILRSVVHAKGGKDHEHH